MKTQNKIQFGLRVRTRREEIGMTQAQLALMSGYTSRSTIAKIESGNSDVARDKIIKIAQALNTSPEYLMGWSEKNEQKTICSNVHQLTPYVKLPKLGAIRAGCPINTNQVLTGEWDYADAEYGDGDHYILDVIGNSMAPTIPDGSEAIIRAQSYAEKGQIVAFGIDGEYATLKRYFPQADGTIFLRGDNPEAASYVVTQQQLENGEAFIIGVVRSYKVNL